MEGEMSNSEVTFRNLCGKGKFGKVAEALLSSTDSKSKSKEIIDINSKGVRSAKTALHRVCEGLANLPEKEITENTRGDFLSLAKLLLARGADVNSKDSDLNTPLHLCFLSFLKIEKTGASRKLKRVIFLHQVEVAALLKKEKASFTEKNLKQESTNALLFQVLFCQTVLACDMLKERIAFLLKEHPNKEKEKEKEKKEAKEAKETEETKVVVWGKYQLVLGKKL